MHILAKKSAPDFDSEITHILETLRDMNPSEEYYKETVANLSTLTEAKAKSQSKSVSKDAVLNITANLLGIFSILGYEQSRVIASKAFSLIRKI